MCNHHRNLCRGTITKGEDSNTNSTSRTMFDFFKIDDKRRELRSQDDVLKEQQENVRSLMESVLNVTLAGFGGVLAGISFSKGGNSVASLSRISSRSVGKRRIRADTVERIVDHDLPVLMGVSCAAFGFILEMVRKISPSSYLISEIQSSHLVQSLPLPNQSFNTNFISDAEIASWSDFTFGGALAGGIFRQIAVSTRTKTAEKLIRRGKLPSALQIARTPYFSGIFTGSVLGFMAGGLLILIHRVQGLIKENDVDNDGDYKTEHKLIALPAIEVKNRITEVQITEDGENMKKLSAEDLRIKIKALKEKLQK